MSEFYVAFKAKDENAKDHVENVIFLRKIVEVWQLVSTSSYSQLIESLKEVVTWILDVYLVDHQPGDAVPK